MNVWNAEGPDMAVRALPGESMKRLAKAAWPVLTILAALFCFSTTSAHADFRVCNATQNLVGVAIGYRVKTGWTTEGWWHIDASSCKTLIEGPLSSRFYYLYAEDAQRGGRWEGPINMCVADKEFKVAGINDCFARGFQRAGFQEYDTGEQSSWMVQLTDESGQTGQPGPDTQSGGAQSPGELPQGEENAAVAPEGAQAQTDPASPSAQQAQPAQPVQNP